MLDPEPEEAPYGWTYEIEIDGGKRRPAAVHGHPVKHDIGFTFTEHIQGTNTPIACRVVFRMQTTPGLLDRLRRDEIGKWDPSPIQRKKKARQGK